MSNSRPTTDLPKSERLTKEANKHWNAELPLLRPKDAATVIILDRTTPSTPKLLMGRRHMRHKFMPGLYVFPGGRVDVGDRHTPYDKDLHPEVMTKLLADMKRGVSPSRARALALAAIRETYEEAGLFLGVKTEGSRPQLQKLNEDWAEFGDRSILPDLGAFRFLARAITPPRRSRRFDTRFFVVDSSAIADQLESGTGPSGELEDLHWLSIDDALKLKLPGITIQVLEDLRDRLQNDPDLEPSYPSPYYYWRSSGMVRNTV